MAISEIEVVFRCPDNGARSNVVLTPGSLASCSECGWTQDSGQSWRTWGHTSRGRL